MLAVTLLGPVATAVRDRPVRLTGRLGRTALAALALHDGRAVAVDVLVDALWGDAPPATAREQVHNQIPRLRRGGLGSAVVTGRVHPHRPPADRVHRTGHPPIASRRPSRRR